jgi:hypothetical protein
MPYALDASKISLNQLKDIILECDLVPSRLPLKTQISGLCSQFSAWGFSHVEDLRQALKTPKKALVLAQTLQLDPQLLVLLRREIEALFPKPIPLREWVWFHDDDLNLLSDRGITHHIGLYEALEDTQTQKDLQALLSPTAPWSEILEALHLTRVRWVSPLTAEMLLKAGYRSPEALAEADSRELFEKLVQVNQNGAYYRGTIGERDIARLIQSAKILLAYSG